MASANGIEIGYKLSSEEFSANDLVRRARAAEDHGFTFALISDHFHPWTDRQGQSPFVWSVLGAIAHATRKLEVGTGVTCPTYRTHPAIIAQAGATTASMMPGRFFLGVGTGENLNEHIVAQGWPELDVRHERLAEAIEVIRLLWRGGQQSHHGKHFDVENARLYTLPEQPPRLMVAAAGPKSAALAVQLGDGLIGTDPDREMVQKFRRETSGAKPCYCEVQVCFDRNSRRAQQVAHEVWPIAGIAGPLMQELRIPSQFEKATSLVTPEKIAELLPCGPDPEKHLQAIRQYVDAGYDHICIHQIGPEQEAFMDFYAREIMPKLSSVQTEWRPAA